MSTARAAFCKWRDVIPVERARRVGALIREILHARPRITQTISEETGKTPFEVLSTDLLATLENLRYLCRNAPEVLRPSKRPTPFIFVAAESYVEYRPRGVVLVIAPWNNPFQLALLPAATALVAGNSVILKPSERTPKTGRLIGELCDRAGFPNDVMHVFTGGPDAARSLIDSRPDMIFFTGGTENGLSIAATAARRMIPVILELGGKDPMIVLADANLDRAAAAAVYGAFAHGGQHCVSVKRLYVEDVIYDAFLRKVEGMTRALAATSDWGSVMDDRARATALIQVREAVDQGARLVFPDDIDRAGSVPTLVADGTPEMRLMREETFAPVLAAARFKDDDEAVRLANESSYGLNSSIWSGDPERCKRMASRLETGNVYINGTLINIGNPYLPFGGVKRSGMGRYHGPEGIRAFCTESSIMVGRSSRRSESAWFPHDEGKLQTVTDLMDLRYGEMGLLKRMIGWVKLFRRT
jgi:acyl-CoA reductase-like NAD-dependent aldehyde dehydrogenase